MKEKPYQPTEEELTKAEKTMTKFQKWESEHREKILSGEERVVVESDDVGSCLPNLSIHKTKEGIIIRDFDDLVGSPHPDSFSKIGREITPQEALDQIAHTEKYFRRDIDRLETGLVQLEKVRQKILDLTKEDAKE